MSRIEALETDKATLDARLEQARGDIVRLEAENARLMEALTNAVTNNVIATILIAIGGGLMGYASFAGGVGHQIALGGVGLLSSGVIILAVSTFRRT